jgi:hypothetical protein
VKRQPHQPLVAVAVALFVALADRRFLFPPGFRIDLL